MSPPITPINLLRGWPSTTLLPTALIAAAAAASLSDPQTSSAALSYGPDPGHEPARLAIAKWLSKAYSRTPPIPPSNLCITGGASQNLGNLLSVYTDPVYTRAIWIVAPAYFLAFGVFEDAGFGKRLRAVREDGEGVDLGGLERRMRECEREWDEGRDVGVVRGIGGERGGPNTASNGYKPERARAKVYKHVVYCVPTFANPSSATMSLDRRRELVRLARRFDALLIADDVYDFLQWPVAAEQSELSNGGLKNASPPPPPPPHQHLLPRLVDVDREIDGGTQRDGADGFGNACSNGSFSKIAGPGVRCGWLEGSEKFAYGVSQTGTTRSGGAPSQLTSTFMTHLLQTQALQQHIKETLQPAYAARYHTLLTAIETHLYPLGFSLPQGPTHGGVAGGFFLWLGLPEGFEAGRFARVCAEGDYGKDGQGGVIVAPGTIFEVPGGDDGEDAGVGFGGFVRVCFAWESEGRLVEGVRRMKSAAERLLAASRGEDGGVADGKGEGEGEYVFVDGRGKLEVEGFK